MTTYYLAFEPFGDPGMVATLEDVRISGTRYGIVCCLSDGAARRSTGDVQHGPWAELYETATVCDDCGGQSEPIAATIGDSFVIGDAMYQAITLDGRPVLALGRTLSGEERSQLAKLAKLAKLRAAYAGLAARSAYID